MHTHSKGPNLALVLLACVVGLSASHTLHAQVVTTFSGADRPLTAAVDDLYSVGSIAGEEWETFSAVEGTDIGFDGAGNLYILDREGAKVVVVGQTGELVRTMGRSGEGPGEFKTPKALAVHQNGSFSVYDRGHFSVMHFGSEGESLGQQRVRSEGVPGRRIRPGAGGTVLSVGGSETMVTALGEPAIKGPLRIYPARGQGVTRVLHLAGAPEDAFPFDHAVVNARLSRGPLRFAFGSRASFGVRRDGTIVLSHSVPYQVDLVSTSGAITNVLTRPISSRPITEQDQERERAYQRDLIDNDNRPRAALGMGGVRVDARTQFKAIRREAIDEMVFAKEFPVIKQVEVDGEDRIWLERTGANPHTTGQIDVIDAQNRYMGTLPAGSLIFPAAFGPDGLVAYIENDEFDVPTVVVKRVRIAEG